MTEELKKAIAFHQIFTSCHPSPLSAMRGKWFNNEHFTRTNTYLESLGKEKIEWYPEELKLDLFAS